MTEYIISYKANRETGGHDCSAAIFRDGELTFAAEVERYSRIKHDNALPIEPIKDCLDHENISIDHIDALAIPDSPRRRIKSLKQDARYFIPKIITSDSRESNLDDLSFVGKAYRIHNRLLMRAEQIMSRRFIQSAITGVFDSCPDIKFVSHHKAHAASAFYPARFDNGLILTIDGQGEDDSTVVWHAQQDRLSRIRTYKDNNSLGKFYSAVTEFLGFRRNNGEGKIMGLAPYGQETDYISQKLSRHITPGTDYDVSNIQYSEDIDEILDWEASVGTNTFTQREKDLALFAQQFLERTVKDLIKSYIDETGMSNVGLAGGVFLNCKLNKEIVELPSVNNYFIQPVAHDGGLSLGAGWDIASVHPEKVSNMRHVYLGPEYQNKEIKTILRESKIDFHEPSNLIDYVVSSLVSGKLIGWFQGRMELGPRALGNRSILADPRDTESRDKINKYVKHRENWRPFAPSMTKEAADTYLKGNRHSPFMIDTFETISNGRDEIEAVLHPGDNTTRPQIISQDQNPRYYDLIRSFGDRTDVPVLLNTSFNDHGEPIVRTPVEAIRSFYSMGLDILVINNYVIEK
jgi:carbamoyltransferase